MGRHLLTIGVLTAICGAGANAVWGPYIGVGVAVLVAVVGAVAVVLRRNRKDREALEQGLPPGPPGNPPGRERRP